MRRMSLGLFSSLFLLLVASLAHAEPPADIILHNGKIFTVDEGQPWAQAVAIYGSRILAVGDDGPVRALAGPDTRSIDLGGRVVVPGFNDAHAHFGVGLPRLTLPPINIPGPGPTLAQALDQVAQAVAVAQPDEWILVFVGETIILDSTVNRLSIDPVAPDNPVILLAWSSHRAVINTRAMTAAGIAPEEPDPFGGFYGRFPNTNVVNGVLDEYALFRLVRAVRAEVPDAVLRAEFEFLSGVAAQLGVTSTQEMTIGLTKARSERILAGAQLKVRIRAMCFPMALDESCQPTLFDPKDRLTSSGIKWILDGTPIERSASLREPWADFPGIGHFNVTDGELAQIVQQALAGPPVRDQLILHTFGDRAIDRALSELELTATAVIWNLRRPRIEHGDLIHPEQIELARRLGVIVVQNPTHLTLDLVTPLGPVRAAEAQPLRSLLEAGVQLAFGSDAIQPNPFVDLFFAIVHPFHPTEALTMEQAVTAYTRGSATAEFQEDQKGAIKPGYLADLAVLSQDIFTIPPPAVPGTVSLLTLVGGEVVWDAGVLVP